MILQGNSFRLALKDESVHVVASSFPYWGLRSYDLDPLVFGAREGCRHEWGVTQPALHPGQVPQTKAGANTIESSSAGASINGTGQFCQLCGAWRGSFGLEPTIDLHVKHAVTVCREIKRVLRSDGVFFLNYGDSYVTSRNGKSAADTKANDKDDRTFRDKPFSTTQTGKRYRLRQDLTAEQVTYVLQELAAFRQVKKVSSPDSTVGINETIATLTGSK